MRPMLISKCPIDVMPGQLESTHNYIAEIKHDGERCVATKINGKVTLLARDKDGVQTIKNTNYPELVEALQGKAADNFVLDGELIVKDENGKSKVTLLQSRSHTQNPTPEQIQAKPITYKVFDIILEHGQHLDMHPLMDRKRILEEFLAIWRFPVIEEVRYTEDIRGLWEQALRDKEEGIVVKAKDGYYSEGRRTNSMLKLRPQKIHYQTVIGYNSKRREISSLITKLGNVSLPTSLDYQRKIPLLMENIPKGNVIVKVQTASELTEKGSWRFPKLLNVYIDEKK